MANVTCARCQKVMPELRSHLQDMTCGFYDTSSGYWATFVNPGENVLCDCCMWATPGYQETYGKINTCGDLGCDICFGFARAHTVF